MHSPSRFLVGIAAALGVAGIVVSAQSAAALQTPPPALGPPWGPAAPAPAPALGAPAAPSAAVAPSSGTVPAGTTLRVGSRGAAVLAMQQRLKALAYDPGKPDGAFGPATQFAVFAFQKVQGMKPTGVMTPDAIAALSSPAGPPNLGGSGDRIEIDLGRQLLMAYRSGTLALISHISSGSGRAYCENGHCGTAITPTGTFSILWSRSGWDTSPLGRLYNPEYFTTAGHAIHGSLSVPLYPASHGCVRIPMHTAAWFPTIVSKGEPVIVR